METAFGVQELETALMGEESRYFNFVFPPLGFADYKILRARVNPVECVIKEFGGREMCGVEVQMFERKGQGLQTIKKWGVIYDFPDKYGRDFTGSRAIVEGNLFENQRNGYCGPTIKVKIEGDAGRLSELNKGLCSLQERVNDGVNWRQFTFLRE